MLLAMQAPGMRMLIRPRASDKDLDELPHSLEPYPIRRGLSCTFVWCVKAVCHLARFMQVHLAKAHRRRAQCRCIVASWEHLGPKAYRAKFTQDQATSRLLLIFKTLHK